MIQSLSNNKPGHVPYRESKLTRLLQVRLKDKMCESKIVCTWVINLRMTIFSVEKTFCISEKNQLILLDHVLFSTLLISNFI